MGGENTMTATEIFTLNDKFTGIERRLENENHIMRNAHLSILNESHKNGKCKCMKQNVHFVVPSSNKLIRNEMVIS